MTRLTVQANNLLNRENYDALYSILRDICVREGVEVAEDHVDHILEQIKAGVN